MALRFGSTTGQCLKPVLSSGELPRRRECTGPTVGIAFSQDCNLEKVQLALSISLVNTCESPHEA